MRDCVLTCETCESFLSEWRKKERKKEKKRKKQHRIHYHVFMCSYTVHMAVAIHRHTVHVSKKKKKKMSVHAGAKWYGINFFFFSDRESYVRITVIRHARWNSFRLSIHWRRSRSLSMTQLWETKKITGHFRVRKERKQAVLEIVLNRIKSTLLGNTSP